MEPSTCDTRKKLLRVLEAHPALASVPRQMLLSDGKRIVVVSGYGHKLHYHWGNGQMVIHFTEGHITFVAEEEGEIVEAISRREGHLQGLDRLPAWVDVRLQELTDNPTCFN